MKSFIRQKKFFITSLNSSIIMKRKELKAAIDGYVVEYFANMISAEAFIDTHIKPYVPVNDEKAEKIRVILAEGAREWDAAPCDPEGASKEQNKFLDAIIDDVFVSIIRLYESQMISQLRTAIRPLNLSEVARRAGVNRMSLASWIDGTSDPRLSKIEAVMRVIDEIRREMSAT